MKFIDFLKNQELNEMALERSLAISSAFGQYGSIIYHLLKVYIGQNLKSAQVGEEWEKQINSFCNNISKIKIKGTNKNIPLKNLEEMLDTIIDDYKETDRFGVISKEIKSYNYDGTPLVISKNPLKFYSRLRELVLPVLKDLSQGKENSFKTHYPKIFEELKKLS